MCPSYRFYKRDTLLPLFQLEFSVLQQMSCYCFRSREKNAIVLYATVVIKEVQLFSFSRCKKLEQEMSCVE